jgi:predicted dehydrogenase
VIRWGVNATGGIATRFADSMTRVAGGEIIAVASRSTERAAEYADSWHVERRYDAQEALAADPDVDAVYIATPHSRHEADALGFLEAGKHVLCEKPFAINAAQGERMIAAAEARGLFLMEAVWSRFLPGYRTITDVIAAGRIGTPLLVEADFGFRHPMDPTHRLFDLGQGGGALLDLGIYPLQLCLHVLGPIAQVAGVATIGETGVDEQVAAVLRHDSGGLGVIKAAITTPLTCAGRISGSGGTIEIPAFMHCPVSITVNVPTGSETIDCSWTGDGLEPEIEEVHRCLAAGLTESPLMPLSETRALAAAMDDIRHQIGLRYPGEA